MDGVGVAMAESVDALKGRAWRCGCLWRQVWLVTAASRAMVDRGGKLGRMTSEIGRQLRLHTFSALQAIDLLTFSSFLSTFFQ